MKQPGEMGKILFLLRPNIGIVTIIGSDHYTNFRTLDATAAEKGVLIESLPKSGTAVLNADDPYVLDMQKKNRCQGPDLRTFQSSGCAGDGYPFGLAGAPFNDCDVSE